MKITQKQLEALHKSGKIRGYLSHEKTKKGIALNTQKLKSAAKEYLEMCVYDFANKLNLEVKKELKFHPVRKWRFDFAIESINLAIEFEGGIFQNKSGHNTAKHYSKDTQKYAQATILGWSILRYTALTFKDAPGDLMNFYQQRVKNR